MRDPDALPPKMQLMRELQESQRLLFLFERELQAAPFATLPATTNVLIDAGKGAP